MLKVNHKLLIKFIHGMGDNVQLQIVLKHIRSQKPNWLVDVAVLPGREDIVRPYCNTVFNSTAPHLYNTIWEPPYVHRWPHKRTPSFPQSWPYLFLKEVNLTPDRNLFYYGLDIKPEWLNIARLFANKLKPYAVIHYQGNSNPHTSYFSHQEVLLVCRRLTKANITPIIIDFEHRSPLPDDETIFRAAIPQATGPLTALISEAEFFIGVDSGPLHLAGCTTTKSIGLWEQKNPANLFALNQNVVHYRNRSLTRISKDYRVTRDYQEEITKLIEQSHAKSTMPLDHRASVARWF